MTEQEKMNFLDLCYKNAKTSGHIFPFMACCEAALESGWGQSQLCKQYNNLFGEKRGPNTANLPSVELPTTEYIDGVKIPTVAKWPIFSSYEESFKSRMNLLKRLRNLYPNYDNALKAKTAIEFVTNVSMTWATDPSRATKVIKIYDEYYKLFNINHDTGEFIQLDTHSIAENFTLVRIVDSPLNKEKLSFIDYIKNFFRKK